MIFKTKLSLFLLFVKITFSFYSDSERQNITDQRVQKILSSFSLNKGFSRVKFKTLHFRSHHFETNRNNFFTKVKLELTLTYFHFYIRYFDSKFHKIPRYSQTETYRATERCTDGLTPAYENFEFKKEHRLLTQKYENS